MANRLCEFPFLSHFPSPDDPLVVGFAGTVMYAATRFIPTTFAPTPGPSTSFSTFHTRFIPSIFPCGTCAPTSTISVYCLHVTAKALPRIFPARCSASSSSTNRMSSVRWWVYSPASCMGSTHATSSDSLWCECHHPGA